MSPVSPVFHTVVTVSIGLKNDWDEISFQTKAPDLIQKITEDRLRHARGPVRSLSLLHVYWTEKAVFGV